MKITELNKKVKQYGEDIVDINSQLDNKASERELSVERERINNLSSLTEGSTTGDAELIDIRVGDDGINYPLSGEAVRAQFKNIKDVILPDVFLDFNKRAKELNSSNKPMIGTFDTLRITEKSTGGHGGFNIQIPTSVKILKFDIEYFNFGVNCGLYYFKGGTLKTYYKTYEKPVSNVVNHIEGVTFEIDWDVVNASMINNDSDNLRFIVWNATGSQVDGYNYLTNISVNNFRNSQKLNDSVLKIEEEIKDVAKRGDVGISDIINRSNQVGESSTMVKWGASNFVYDQSTGIISFSYDQPTGNNGFQTPVFNCSGNYLKVSGELLTLSGSGGLSVSLSGRTKSDNTQVCYSLGGVSRVGKFEIECDIRNIFEQRGELLLNTISIVFSNSGVMNITAKDINVFDIDTLKKGSTLDEILNNITNNIDISDVKNNDIIIATHKQLVPWSGGRFEIIGDVLSFTHPTENGNSGAITGYFRSATNFINVKGKVLSITKYNELSKMQIVVVGQNSNNEIKSITVTVITETGEFNVLIDLNNLVVYHGLDLTKSIQILLGSINKVDIEVENYTVYESKFPQSNLITQRLDETLINFDKEFTSINAKLIGLENGTNDSLTAPNGSKYIIQVDNDSNLFTVPVIPKKVLFIGNSLLLGHDTFGMCAKDSKNDYYYHVKEYLKTFNPDVICDKQHGAPFEQTESQSGIDSWIASNINNKATDYDLVVIQLGDNVNNDARNELFKTSCKQLLQAIRTHMPRARVVWAGEWYYTAQRQEIIAKGCADTGSIFIDITDLTIKENQGAIGDIITADDGTTFIVESSGVASHPGDKGMKAIADRLIEKLFK